MLNEKEVRPGCFTPKENGSNGCEKDGIFDICTNCLRGRRSGEGRPLRDSRVEGTETKGREGPMGAI